MDGRIDEIGRLSASMDRRFDEVTTALVEQREYTEYGYQRLDRRIGEVSDLLGRRFDALDGRFDALERRFDALEGRFDHLEQKLDTFIDARNASGPSE